MRPFGVFGGMFDPIHFGHLRAAHELHERLALESVGFFPAGDPPHRAAPLADARTRLAMLRAAVADDPRFLVDDRELRRPGPSYTILTLEELRAERGAQPLVLLLGASVGCRKASDGLQHGEGFDRSIAQRRVA